MAVKGCFVCEKDHYANERHPKHKVDAALQRLNWKAPTAFLSISDFADFFKREYGGKEENLSGDEDEEINEVVAIWAEGDRS